MNVVTIHIYILVSATSLDG